MAYQQIIIASIFVLILCIQNGSALKCYDCNSHNDTRCAMDDLPDELLRNCPSQHTNGKPYILCRKIKQVIDFEVNGLLPDSRIIRNCGWDDSSHTNRCYHRSGFGGRQEVCACDGDKCNGTNQLYGSATLLIIGLIGMLKIAL